MTTEKASLPITFIGIDGETCFSNALICCINLRDYTKYETTEIIAMDNGNVTMAAHQYGKGRGIYMAGLPYTPENSKALYRAMFYSLQKENEIHVWYAENPNVEVHVYPDNKLVAIVNNTNEVQETKVYDGAGNVSVITLKASELRWEEYNEEGTFKLN